MMLTDQELQSLRNMGNEAEAAADEIERMRSWLEGDCSCPCCAESRECAEDCTFSSDCPEEAGQMAGAREALYGTNNDSNPLLGLGSSDGLGPLLEGWANVECVRFVSRSTGQRTTETVSRDGLLDLMRAVQAAERERIAASWDGIECDVHCNGIVDVGASIRAGRLVDRDEGPNVAMSGSTP